MNIELYKLSEEILKEVQHKGEKFSSYVRLESYLKVFLLVATLMLTAHFAYDGTDVIALYYMFATVSCLLYIALKSQRDNYIVYRYRLSILREELTDISKMLDNCDCSSGEFSYSPLVDKSYLQKIKSEVNQMIV